MNYQNADIKNGLECWLDPENCNLYCEDCAFHKESRGNGTCKKAVWRETKRILEERKWISVKDKLPDPKEYDWVLGAVITLEDRLYLPPQVVELRNGKWWGNDDFPISALNCEVTHWMPLPELPKEV